MLNPSDKELDRLCREAAEQFEPDEQISSWEQLVPRLDREIGIRRPSNPSRYFGRGSITYMVAILAVSSLSFWLIRQKKELPQAGVTTATVRPSRELPKTNTQTQSATTNEITESSVTPDRKAASTASTPVREASFQTEKSTGEQVAAKPNTPQPADTRSADKLQGTGERTVLAAGTVTLVAADPAKVSPSQKSRGNHGNGRLPAPALATASVAAASDEVNDSHAKASGTSGSGMQKYSSPPSAYRSADQLSFATLGGILPVSSRSPGYDDSYFTGHNKSQLSLSAAAKEQSRQTQRYLRQSRALKIGLQYGSDVTSVHAIAPERLSNSFGLTIGYQLFDHWSLNTGIIYTKKNYSADAKDFHPAYSNLPSWSHLEYVTGECNMWEIPLTIRYDFDRIGNTTFFLNGGASSYIMTHESYVFYTHYYNSGSPVMRASPAIPYDTHGSYLFAVIDLSMGVEQQLNKSLSFQVEPFLRIPVAGVGYGNVDLSSFGVNFALRYAPLLKSSRH